MNGKGVSDDMVGCFGLTEGTKEETGKGQENERKGEVLR
jgi:hypothetical protein